MIKIKLYRRQNRDEDENKKIVSLNISHFLTGAYYSHVKSY